MDPNEPLVKRRKRTVIFTTGRYKQAAPYADAVFELQKGGLVETKEGIMKKTFTFLKRSTTGFVRTVV